MRPQLSPLNHFDKRDFNLKIQNLNDLIVFTGLCNIRNNEHQLKSVIYWKQ